MDLFEAAVADVLEVDEISGDAVFRDTAGWSSLQGFGLLVLLENDWATPLRVEQFLALRTVRDLEREALLSLAAEVLGVPRASLSGATAYGAIPAWDSVNHLRLVREAEARFGRRYPSERIPALRTLDDFLIDG